MKRGEHFTKASQYQAPIEYLPAYGGRDGRLIKDVGYLKSKKEKFQAEKIFELFIVDKISVVR
jgi:hypothetical protein